MVTAAPSTLAQIPCPRGAPESQCSSTPSISSPTRTSGRQKVQPTVCREFSLEFVFRFSCWSVLLGLSHHPLRLKRLNPLSSPLRLVPLPEFTAAQAGILEIISDASFCCPFSTSRPSDTRVRLSSLLSLECVHQHLPLQGPVFFFFFFLPGLLWEPFS